MVAMKSIIYFVLDVVRQYIDNLQRLYKYTIHAAYFGTPVISINPTSSHLTNIRHLYFPIQLSFHLTAGHAMQSINKFRYIS